MNIAHKFGKNQAFRTAIHVPAVELLFDERCTTTRVTGYRMLVPIRTSGSKPPFFCMHGSAGNTSFLHRLAWKLDSEQPFYAINPEGLDGVRFYPTTVEEMAAHYLSEIRKVQPVGPYYLGGYRFGGIIAFEMAQQLQRQEEEAKLVVLFDTRLRYHGAPGSLHRPRPSPKSRRASLTLLLRVSRSLIYKKSANLVEGIYLKLFPAAYRSWLALGLRIPPSMRTLHVMKSLLRAEYQYVPKRYPGGLVLFHGADYKNDPNLGWDGLADYLEHHIIGRSTESLQRNLMNEPLVQQTARELDACIGKRFKDSMRARTDSVPC